MRADGRQGLSKGRERAARKRHREQYRAREIGDSIVTARKPRQRRIMTGNDDAVRGKPRICLDDIGASRDGSAIGLKRVLGVTGGIATMRDGERSGHDGSLVMMRS